MKRMIRGSWEYSSFISEDVPGSVQAFLDADSADYHLVKDAVDAFKEDIKKFPAWNGIDSLNAEYDEDKHRFYSKYKPFADRCKELAKTVNPSGYGRDDYLKLKTRDLLRFVDYIFPYGWRVH